MSTDYLLPENALEVVKGSSRTLPLEVTDPVTGLAVNLTSSSIYFTVKRKLSDAIPLIQKTTTLNTEIALTAPRLGQAEIYLLPADTVRMDIGSYLFDVWVILADGKRHPVVPPSSFEVKPSVTVLT